MVLPHPLCEESPVRHRRAPRAPLSSAPRLARAPACPPRCARCTAAAGAPRNRPYQSPSLPLRAFRARPGAQCRAAPCVGATLSARSALQRPADGRPYLTAGLGRHHGHECVPRAPAAAAQLTGLGCIRAAGASVGPRAVENTVAQALAKWGVPHRKASRRSLAMSQRTSDGVRDTAALQDGLSFTATWDKEFLLKFHVRCACAGSGAPGTAAHVPLPQGPARASQQPRRAFIKIAAPKKIVLVRPGVRTALGAPRRLTRWRHPRRFSSARCPSAAPTASVL
jgi:hypothetical protein